MNTLHYQGRNVYTQSNRETTERDLERAKVQTDCVEDVYFFTIDGDRRVNKIDFDRQKIGSNQSGLFVRVKGNVGSASVSIAGLDRILEFLVDANCIGKDLSTLKGRPITSYNEGLALIGISPQNSH